MDKEKEEREKREEQYQETKAKLEREAVSDFLFKEVNKINDRYRKTLERGENA